MGNCNPRPDLVYAQIVLDRPDVLFEVYDDEEDLPYEPSRLWYCLRCSRVACEADLMACDCMLYEGNWYSLGCPYCIRAGVDAGEAIYLWDSWPIKVFGPDPQLGQRYILPGAMHPDFMDDDRAA